MATDAEKLVIVLEAQSHKLQNELVRTNRLIDRFAAQTERRFDQMQKRNAASFERLNASVRGSLSGLQSLIAPIVGTLGVREIIRYADAWTEAGNKIAAASQVAGIEARSLDELKQGANGARQELEGYVDLYARLLRVSPGVAATELEVAKATDIVAKSLKAGGASAQEQAAALIQLGQAIGSGFLQGDELRSLRENAPLLAKAIADEFGVTIGQLKELGAEGKITSDRVFKAILNGADEIEAAFNATQSTIRDAFTRIGNEFTAYIGTVGQANGATQGLIDALNYLADHFKEIAPVVVEFATVLAGAFAGRAIIVPIVQATVALGGFLAAMATGTLTAVTFSAALGPIALIAGAAAAAYALMVYAEGDAARAADAHNKTLAENQNKLDLARDSSDQFRAALQKQIALQLKAAAVALSEARAQVDAAKVKAQAQADYVYKVDRLMGVSDAKIKQHQDELWSGIVGESEEKLRQAENNFYDFKRQFAEIDAIRLTPEGDGDKPGKGDDNGGGGGGGKTKADSPFQNATDSILKRTAALEAQTAAQAELNPLVNDYGFAVEKAKAASDLLQTAMDAGLAVTPELKATIDQLATGYAQATVEAAKLAEAQGKALDSARDWFDLGRDVTRGFINDLIEGKSAAEALGNVLNSLGNKLIDLGLDALFGGGGKDFGLIGKALGFADGGVYANGRSQPLQRFAGGGVSRTAAIFGEAGPEAAVPLPDGRRIPVDLRMPSGGAAGGLTVSVPITVDARGADPAAISRLQATVAQMKAELPASVVSAVRQARKTGNLR